MISFVSFAMAASIIVAFTDKRPEKPEKNSSSNPRAARSETSLQSQNRVKNFNKPAEKVTSTPHPKTLAISRKHHRWILGIEAVGFQIPNIRLPQIDFDRRVLGKSSQLGGGGLFLRLQIDPTVSLESTIRSGFVRYRDSERQSIFRGMVAFDIGTIAYLARGKAGRIGLDTGMGGIYNMYQYKLGPFWGTGSQHFGSFHVRGGIDAEFVQNHFLIGMNIRSYGVITPRHPAKQTGDVFQKLGQSSKSPPVPQFQSYLVASLSFGYFF